MTTDPTETARYRRRSEADAIQWTGTNESALSVFCSPFDFQTIEPEDRVEDPDQTAAVRTHPHGGWVGLAPGDWVVREAGRYTRASDEEFRAGWAPAAGPAPATDQAALDLTAALAEDLRYVFTYRGPHHQHDRPGVWDTSGKPCEHCARLAVVQRNLAAYDADPAAVLPASTDGGAVLREAADLLRRPADETPQEPGFVCKCPGWCGHKTTTAAPAVAQPDEEADRG